MQGFLGFNAIVGLVGSVIGIYVFATGHTSVKDVIADWSKPAQGSLLPAPPPSPPGFEGSRPHDNGAASALKALVVAYLIVLAVAFSIPGAAVCLALSYAGVDAWSWFGQMWEWIWRDVAQIWFWDRTLDEGKFLAVVVWIVMFWVAMSDSGRKRKSLNGH